MVIVDSNENGKNHGSTYFGENGKYMSIHRSFFSRKKFVNNNDNECFAHKWKKSFPQIKLHSKL